MKSPALSADVARRLAEAGRPHAERDELMTSEELAVYLRRSRRAVVAWAHRHHVIPRHVGRRLLFVRREVDAEINRRRSTRKPEHVSEQASSSSLRLVHNSTVPRQ